MLLFGVGVIINMTKSYDLYVHILYCMITDAIVRAKVRDELYRAAFFWSHEYP